MLDTSYYKVTREIAQRSGLINVRYRTQDGFYILDNVDLSRIRIKSSEYLTGLQGVEKISKEEAKTIIEQNGYMMGEASIVETKAPTSHADEPDVNEPEPSSEETQEQEQGQNDAEPTEEAEEIAEEVAEENKVEE